MGGRVCVWTMKHLLIINDNVFVPFPSFYLKWDFMITTCFPAGSQ